MGKLAQTATVSTTQEVVLEPKLRQKIVTKLKSYAGLKTQLDTIKEKIDTLKEELGTLRDETGETSVSLEGFGTVTLVAPVRSKFDPKLFVKNGGDLDIYNQSVISVPVKSYTKVTLPGEKEDS